MTFFQVRFHADGVIPFWLPDLFAGMPLPESLGPSFFYPTDLLCWAAGVPVHRFYAWDAAVHLVLAAAGVFALVRRLGAAPAAAAVGAVSYVVGGYGQVQLAAGTQVFIRAYALVPWVFVAVEALAEDPVWRRAVPVAVLFALLVLTHNFQMLAYGAVVLPASLALWPRARRPWARWTVLGGGAVAMAGALSAVVLVPAWVYLGYSFRSEPSSVWAGMEFLRWPQAVMLALPDWRGDGNEAKYLGVIPAVLAVAALAVAPRRTLGWGGLGLLALVLAGGPQTPAGALLAWLPLFLGFRAASHWILFVQLAVSVLAGLALTAEEGGWRRRRRALAAALGGAAVLAVMGRLLVPAGQASAAHAWVAAAAVCAAGGAALLAGEWLPPWSPPALLLLLIAADAALPGRPHPRLIAAAELGAWNGERAGLALLAREAPGSVRIYSEEPHEFLNSRIGEGLEWTSGYHGAFLGVYGRFYDAAFGCGHVLEAMRVLGARYAVVRELPPAGDLVPLRRFAGGDGTPLWLCRNDRFLGGVFVPTEVIPDSDGVGAQRALCAGKLATERMAWVQSAAPDLPPRRSAPALARVTHREPNELVADVAARDRSLVVFSEISYPAWKAFIDGRRAALLRADLLLRAVVVPPGHHVIRLVYDSLWFKLGLWLSGVSVVALAAGAACSGRGRN